MTESIAKNDIYSADKTRGVIFDIQRFAVHDGPGIRTTVFLKGCTNRCGWCHNPESFSMEARLRYYASRCVLCGKCALACPRGAHIFTEGANINSQINDHTDSHINDHTGDHIDDHINRHTIDRARCVNCGACVSSCYSYALAMDGRRATVGDIMNEILEDIPYYESSGGGVTLSGGEPVMQRDFTLALLRKLKENNIRTNIQTAGNYPFEYIEPLLPLLDMIMYDIKGVSDEIYTRHIRGDRTRILENLKLLDAAIIDDGFPLIVRTPVIEGVNADAAEIGAIARHIRSLKHLASYRLIPYHGLGRAKYESLDMPYDNEYKTPSPQKMKELEAEAARYVPVGDTK